MFNPALMAARQDKKSEHSIENRLRGAGALGASSAVPVEVDGMQRKWLEQAIEQGTVVKTPDGRFYLNERAVTDRKEGQIYMVLLILLAIGSVLATVLVLTAKAGG